MEKAYDVPKKTGIQLDANEKPANLSEKLREEIAKKVATVVFNRYPDNQAIDLCKAYGRYCGVSAEQVIAGNGSDEILGLLISLFINQGGKCYTLDPDFSMYDYFVSRNQGKMISYKLGVEEEFNVVDFIEQGKKEQVDLIVFSNPNNPTGQIVPQQDILKIVEAFANIPVIIDEAYIEFYGQSMIAFLDMYQNLGITRTLSKACGLAGIRCGFLLGNTHLIETVRPLKVPYNVNILTQLAATTVLSYPELIKKDIQMLKEERNRVYSEYLAINPMSLKLYPSEANYFYGKYTNSELITKLFSETGISPRFMEEGVLRLTVGSSEDNQLLIEMLHKLKNLEEKV